MWTGATTSVWTARRTEEMHRVIPVLQEGGGCVFASDHSIPDSASLEDFLRIAGLYKELARYDSRAEPGGPAARHAVERSFPARPGTCEGRQAA